MALYDGFVVFGVAVWLVSYLIVCGVVCGVRLICLNLSISVIFDGVEDRLIWFSCGQAASSTGTRYGSLG